MTDRELFIQTWAKEVPLTLRVFESLPEAQLGYRPHEKNRTARAIVGHLLGHAEDLIELLGESGELNHRTELSFEGIPDSVQRFRKSASRVGAMLSSVDEETWGSLNVKFKVDGHVHFEAPLGMTAWVLLLDTIHHRGQLSSYIRPMGGVHPDIYGSSGDSESEH